MPLDYRHHRIERLRLVLAVTEDQIEQCELAEERLGFGNPDAAVYAAKAEAYRQRRIDLINRLQLEGVDVE